MRVQYWNGSKWKTIDGEDVPKWELILESEGIAGERERCLDIVKRGAAVYGPMPGAVCSEIIKDIEAGVDLRKGECRGESGGIA